MTQPWQPIETAPRGPLLDVKFDIASAEVDGTGKNMADFYAPGCRRRRNPVDPVICGVRYSRGHFRPVLGELELYAILSVTLTHWRPADPSQPK